jgi:hypothetical protein
VVKVSVKGDYDVGLAIAEDGEMFCKLADDSDSGKRS